MSREVHKEMKTRLSFPICKILGQLPSLSVASPVYYLRQTYIASGVFNDKAKKKKENSSHFNSSSISSWFSQLCYIILDKYNPQGFFEKLLENMIIFFLSQPHPQKKNLSSFNSNFLFWL